MVAPVSVLDDFIEALRRAIDEFGLEAVARVLDNDAPNPDYVAHLAAPGTVIPGRHDLEKWTRHLLQMFHYYANDVGTSLMFSKYVNACVEERGIGFVASVLAVSVVEVENWLKGDRRLVPPRTIRIKLVRMLRVFDDLPIVEVGKSASGTTTIEVSSSEWRALIVRCVIDLGVKKTARIIGISEKRVIEYERGISFPAEGVREHWAEPLRIALMGFWWKLPKATIDRVNAPDEPKKDDVLRAKDGKVLS